MKKISELRSFDLGSTIINRKRIKDNQMSIYNMKTRGITFSHMLSKQLFYLDLLNLRVFKDDDIVYFIFDKVKGFKLSGSDKRPNQKYLAIKTDKVVVEIERILGLSLEKGEKKLINFELERPNEFDLNVQFVIKIDCSLF